MTDSAFTTLVRHATADLATRVGCEPHEIRLVSMTDVVWPDASLGCPEAGMRFKQVQVEGAIVELAYSGVVYEYHCAGTRAVLCVQSAR